MSVPGSMSTSGGSWTSRGSSAPGGPSTSEAAIPFGVSVPVGAAAVAMVCLCSGALPVGEAARLWLPALTVGGIAYVTADLRAGLALAGIGFLLVDGFLENRAGLLSWHPGDQSRLGLLLACAVLGATLAALGPAIDRRRARRARRRMDRQLAVVEQWANTGAWLERGEESR